MPPGSAQQVRNATEEPVRILMVSTLIVPEILVIGAPNLGEDPREDVDGQRDWWAD